MRRLGGALDSKDKHKEHFYLVATKTITQFKFSPIGANFGIKATNPSVLGIAGNATNWQDRRFGAVGFVAPGPVKSKIIVGLEFLQESRHLAGLPGASLPTTLTHSSCRDAVNAVFCKISDLFTTTRSAGHRITFR